MAKDANPTLDQLIGANVRRLREAENATQDEYARRVRVFLPQWSQSTIAALEKGRKTLDTSEVTVLMCAIPATREDLFAPEGSSSDAFVQLTPELAMPPAAVQNVWTAKTREEIGAQMAESRGVFRPIAGARTQRWFEARSQQLLRYRRILPRFTSEQFEAAVSAARDESTTKGARRLGVEDPTEVALAAIRVWGRSLTEEREGRIAKAAPADASARTLQALRGHVTRTLLEEIEPILRKAAQ